ncbi:hypothetical protein [Listeria cornellensis]|uniref:Uncharacterized protein n=1 Tax=Listeria cornellensis FSL F6-0969 TaxID=1265820 RepID=W7C1L6_9LIST|nr:hypothetical protein [Listeria cornellensis]EUJ26468.1 hypothetical protein PCORN_14919 [Listeria cornellensis FSL F6-0969]
MIIDELRKDKSISVIVTHNLDHEIITVYAKNRDTDSIDQDSAVRLKNFNSDWILYRVQRVQEFLIKKFSNETLAKLALFVSVSREFSSIDASTDVRGELRALKSDLEAADKYIENEIGSDYYSFFEDKVNCINLKLRENACYDIYYLSPTGDIAIISEDRQLPSAFIVVYNFSFILKRFKEVIYPQLINYNLSSNQVELLKRIYLKK